MPNQRSNRDQKRDYLLFVDVKTTRPGTRLLTIELFEFVDRAIKPADSLILAEDPESTLDKPATDRFFTNLQELRGWVFQADPLESSNPEWNRIESFVRELPFVNFRLMIEIFYPRLVVDHLEGYCRAFAISTELSNAEMCWVLTDMIGRKLRSLPGAIQRQLRTVFRGLPRQYEKWLQNVRSYAATTSPEVNPTYLLSLERFENLTSGNAVAPAELPDLFSGSSKHLDVIADFEIRPGQSHYAQKVLANLAEGGVSLLEAATGTGKSIGYLLPLLAVCHANDERGVVVTRTKSLQEQLFRSDLRKIARLIPDGMQIAILKGLANYLCLLRFKVFISDLADLMGRYPAESLAALIVWEHDTKSGDLTETAILESGGVDRLSFRVTVDEGSCLRRNCQFYNDCYGYKARRQAVKSQVVITNYALLFSDLVSNAELLGKMDHIIFDEAHRIQAEAVSAFSETVPLQTLSRWLERLSGERFRGFLAASLQLEEDDFSASDFANTAALLSDVTKLLYQDLRNTLDRAGLEPGARVRFLAGDQIHELIARCVTTNRGSFQVVRSLLSELQQSPPSTTDDSDLEGVTSLRRVIAHVISYLETLFKLAATGTTGPDSDDADENLVYWVFVGSSGDIVITVAPIEVGGLLHDRLYPRYYSLLFTSATLESEDDFAWIKARLGLHTHGGLETRQARLPSPFPLSDQLKVMLARFLPPPNHPEYVRRLGKMLNRIVKATPLPTLVLCTSYQVVDKLAGLMAKEVDPTKLLIQSSDVPAQTLLNRFRRQKRGVLIGTESFWEGIDLPGDLLRLLILTRLPFAVPDDPLERARQERATQAGENAFMTVSIPAAVLKYRQGIGRMIRSASDWGTVIVTDSRMGHKRYGQIFIAASPVEVAIYDQEPELLKMVESWLLHHGSS